MIKLNNKGLTLIELIISMAATTIVMGAIIMFMASGSTYYQKINAEAAIQTEGQIVMNQLTDMMLTANWVHAGATGTSIYYMDNSNDGMVKTISRNSIRNVLLYTEEYINATGSTIKFRDDLMGEYFTDFQVSPASIDFSSSRNITITLKLEKNGREEVLTNTVVMRNKPLQPAVLGGIVAPPPPGP